ncbi:MAG: Ldh family oxidoreductase [Promethearchaeota archaeon]
MSNSIKNGKNEKKERKIEDDIFVPFEDLYNLERDCFIGMGVPKEDAKICADVVFEADKRGIDSHGVGRLFMYYVRVKRKQQSPVTKIEVVSNKGAIARLNVNNGMGQVAGHKAMELAIEKAMEYGIGMVVVENSNHYGIAGYYSLMASRQNMIGITGTNARPSIAPTWSVEPVIGTNPLTIALPTDWGFDWFADHALSITQRGKIELYSRLGKRVPKGWVIDINGENPTDSSQILKDLLAGKAALTPLGGSGEDLGGYKGYNYALFVEILSAGLNTANYLRNCLGFVVENGEKKHIPFNLGHFFIAIDIDAFIDVNYFKKKVGEILRMCVQSRKQPNAKKIYIAGEKEYLIEQQRKKQGIPIPKATQLQLQQMIHDLKLNESKYKIPWNGKFDPNSIDSQGW